MERHPDELWTSYLMRRLEAEGFQFEDYGRLGGVYLTAVYRPLPPQVTDIEISRDLAEVEDLTQSLEREKDLGLRYRGYRDFELNLLARENILIGPDNPFGDPAKLFRISSDGLVSVEEFAPAVPLPDYLAPYLSGQTYKAEEVIENIVRYCRENKREVPQEEEAPTRSYPAARLGVPELAEEPPPALAAKKEPSALEKKLDELQRDVRRLLHLAGENTLMLQGEENYFPQLYVRAINEGVNNLQFLEYRGRRIPYVLVHSSDLDGQVGRPFHNLYFVARDLAPEEWQQKIVAFHESMCMHFNHHDALAAEPRLARLLGKEEEYRKWRKEIEAKLE